MKKLLVFSFMLAFLANIKGQDYIPFPMDSAIWSVNTTKYFVHGDTVIANKHYSKVWMQTDSVEFTFDMDKAFYYAAIRNDTTNKKVYGVYHKADTIYDYIWEQGHLDPLRINCDTCELLLYNFDIRNSADTFYVYSFPFLSSQFKEDTDNYPSRLRYQHTMEYKITGFQSRTDTILGVARNIIFFPDNGNFSYYVDYWIEGIGSSAGLFSFGNYLATTYCAYIELLCVTEKEQYLYKQDTVCYKISEEPGNVREYANSNDFTIYPNPVADYEFWIKSTAFNNTFSEFDIELFDIYGKRVMYISIGDTNTPISISHLRKGVYIYKISNKLKQKGYGKIIAL